MASATIFTGYSTPVENRSLILITKDIKEGKYKNEIEKIRALAAEGKNDEADKLKRKLLAFTPSATFIGGRTKECLDMYSQFVILDLDNLTPGEINTAFMKVIAIPYTFSCFRSPINGLKILVEITSTQEFHEQAYKQVADYYEQQLGLIVDRSGKDITWLCFVSYDPDAYRTINNEKFPIIIDGILQKESVTTMLSKNEDHQTEESNKFVLAFEMQIKFTNQKSEYTLHNRNNYIYLLASNCNRAGIPEADTIALASQQFNLSENEIKTTVRSAYMHHINEHAVYTSSTLEYYLPTQNDLSTLPDEIFPALPDFLQRIVKIATSKEERDILLLGSIVALSSCLPNLIGYYDSKKVNANLYLFITAQASAGKGRLIHCRQLVAPIHKAMRTQANALKKEYDAQMLDYNSKKGKDSNLEKPVKPPEKMLFIPANNSSTGFFQLLNDSGGKGFIFEAEGDTMSQAFKSDYGNYSHGFRNAFQHEPITYYRRTDREYVEIERPCLSALLSGTPKQISSLIPNAENGLFSRFMFYVMNIQDVWNIVFENNANKGLDEYFANLASEFYTLYQALNNQPEIVFTLTSEQENLFNQYFAEAQTMYISLKGIDYVGTIRRSGLIAFRMMMVISVLRILETGELSNQLICENNDFESALKMIKLLVKHAAKVYSDLPEEPIKTKPKNRKERFLNALPYTFNRQTYLSEADKLGIPDKTAQGYITEFVKAGLLNKHGQDQYINPAKAKPDS